MDTDAADRGPRYRDAAASIIALAFSPIMMQLALVLPAGNVGMMAASAMRRPPTPRPPP
jgi:hypothetical protein